MRGHISAFVISASKWLRKAFCKTSGLGFKDFSLINAFFFFQTGQFTTAWPTTNTSHSQPSRYQSSFAARNKLLNSWPTTWSRIWWRYEKLFVSECILRMNLEERSRKISTNTTFLIRVEISLVRSRALEPLLCCFSGWRPTMLLSCSSTMAPCRLETSVSMLILMNRLVKAQTVLCWNSFRNLSFQVNFYTDHTKIILCKSSDSSYLLTYISRERVSYTYLLSMLNEMGCTAELRHRLRYVVQLLQHHTDAWEQSAVLYRRSGRY